MEESRPIMFKLLPVIHLLFKMGAIFSLILATPALISLVFKDGLFFVHLYSGAISFAVCSLVALLTRRNQRELQPKDGFTLVFLVWIVFGVVAALPFWLSINDCRFIDAFYEAISGLTTTGNSAFNGLDKLAPSLNFWRHMLNWLGGMGIIVLAVAVLPILGVGGMQLFRAEISGINKTRKMTPRIASTAKNMWNIYLGFTLIIFVLLMLTGMDWFDALCHAMSSVSLGGFSTHDASIAHFNSVSVELILAFGMILGGISFTNHFLAIREKSIKAYWRDLEVRASFYILFGSIVGTTFYLWTKGVYGHDVNGLLTSLRYTFFNFVSIGLACGYANYDYSTWPLIAALWLYVLPNFLANSGSTGGGIKMIRAIVLVKFLLREMKVLLHPNAVTTVKINNYKVPTQTALTVMAFIFVYFTSIVLFSFVMMATGLDLVSSYSIIIASITNTGPALGNLGPLVNATALTDFQKAVSMFVMLLGRLEIFTVIIIFSPDYWRR